MKPKHKLGAGMDFDWLMTFFGALFVGGVFLDGWAHIHLSPALETFFAPWHAILYLGYLCCAASLICVFGVNLHCGFSWRQALPHHYFLSLVGVVVFALGGFGELAWHRFFGIESDLESLLSPTHLALAFGAALIVGGPLRAMLHRDDQGKKGLIADLPALLSATYFLSIFAFMGQYIHPLVDIWPAQQSTPEFFGQALGIAQVVFFTVLLMSLVLMLLRRRDLPVGSFTLILGLHSLLMTFLHGTQEFVFAAVAAGAIIDMLVNDATYDLLHPRVIRLFGFAVPVIFFLFYFVAIELAKGIIWSTHLWVGAIIISGLVGWLMSYLVVQPYHEHHAK